MTYINTGRLINLRVSEFDGLSVNKTQFTVWSLSKLLKQLNKTQARVRSISLRCF